MYLLLSLVVSSSLLLVVVVFVLLSLLLLLLFGYLSIDMIYDMGHGMGLVGTARNVMDG